MEKSIFYLLCGLKETVLFDLCYGFLSTSLVVLLFLALVKCLRCYDYRFSNVPMNWYGGIRGDYIVSKRCDVCCLYCYFVWPHIVTGMVFILDHWHS